MTMKTILIIDDSTADLQLMSGLLRDNYRVQVAKTPERGLELARSDAKPDLILLDVLLPRMDGYELCEQLKQSPETQPIPVVFVTGNVTDEERWRGLEIGAEAYLVKPIDPNRMERVINKLIG